VINGSVNVAARYVYLPYCENTYPLWWICLYQMYRSLHTECQDIFRSGVMGVLYDGSVSHADGCAAKWSASVLYIVF